MKYHIQQLLESGTDRWHTVCTCITPEGAGEVVKVILQQAQVPIYLRIEVVDD